MDSLSSIMSMRNSGSSRIFSSSAMGLPRSSRRYSARLSPDDSVRYARFSRVDSSELSPRSFSEL